MTKKNALPAVALSLTVFIGSFLSTYTIANAVSTSDHKETSSLALSISISGSGGVLAYVKK